jgi:hypothetical protein
MSATNKSLKEALQRVSGRPQPAESPDPTVTTAPTPSAAPPSRQGKKGIVIYVSKEAAHELKQLSLDMDRPIQDLGVEALNDLLGKYRRKQIA